MRFVSEVGDAGPTALWFADEAHPGWKEGPEVKMSRVRVHRGGEPTPCYVPRGRALSGVELDHLAALPALIQTGGSGLLARRAAENLSGAGLRMAATECAPARWQLLYRCEGAQFPLGWDWLEDPEATAYGSLAWCKAVLSEELPADGHRVGAALLCRLALGPRAALRILGAHNSAPGFADTYRTWMEWEKFGGCSVDVPAHPDAAFLARVMLMSATPGASPALVAHAARFGDPIAEALVNWAYATQAGEEAFDPAIDRCGAIAEELDSDPLRVMALESRALLAAFSGEQDKAVRLVKQALQLIDSSVPGLALMSLSTLASCHDAAGDLQRAAEAWGKAVPLAEAAFSPDSAMVRRAHHSRALRRLGNRAEAQAVLSTGTPSGTRSKNLTDFVLAELHLDVGNFPAARRHVSDQLPPGVLPGAAAYDLQAAAAMGTIEGGGLWTLPSVDDQPFRSSALVLDVSRAAHLGKGDPAGILARCEQMGDWENACRAAGWVAELASRTGNGEVALDAWRIASKHARRCGVWACGVRTRRQQGQLLGRFVPERSAEAQELLDGALEDCRAQGDLYGEVLCRLHLALHDTESSAWHATRALGICESNGYAALRGTAVTLLRLHGGDMPSAGPEPDWLRSIDLAADLGTSDELPARIGAMQERLTRLPAGLRPFVQRTIAPALRRAGLSMTPGSSTTALLLDDEVAAVYLGTQQLATFRPQSLQYQLLVTIAAGGDQDRAALMGEVWSEPYRPPSSDNKIHVAVNRLRQRLAGADLKIVSTERGGFALAPAHPVYRRSIDP